MSNLKKILALFLCFMLLPALWLAVEVDMWSGGSGRLGFSVFFILFGLAVALPSVLTWHSRLLLLPFALYVIALVALRFVDLSPVKPAIRVVNQIQPGMSVSNAVVVFNREFPAGGRFRRPVLREIQPGHYSCMLDPDDGRYNAAIIQIEFTNGVCTSARFFPD